VPLGRFVNLNLQLVHLFVIFAGGGHFNCPGCGSRDGDGTRRIAQHNNVSVNIDACLGIESWRDGNFLDAFSDNDLVHIGVSHARVEWWRIDHLSIDLNVLYHTSFHVLAGLQNHFPSVRLSCFVRYGYFNENILQAKRNLVLWLAGDHSASLDGDAVTFLCNWRQSCFGDFILHEGVIRSLVELHRIKRRGFHVIQSRELQ